MVKEVQECYLRDDVGCGVAGCACPSADGAAPLTPSAEASHYCVVAADALAAYAEVLELPDVADVILCASEVRAVTAHASLRVASRVRALCRDARRRLRVLPDAHAAPVVALAAAERLEPPLAVAAWYALHLDPPPRSVVVLSDTLAARYSRPASDGAAAPPPSLPPGVEVLSAAAFFPRYYAHAPAVVELHDALAAAAAERAAAAAAAASAAPSGALEAGPLSEAELEAGMASGELVKGVLAVSRRWPEEGTVRAEGSAGGLVLLPSRASFGRAMHGDVVAVRLLPRADWRVPRAAATAEEAPPDMAAAAGDDGGGAADDAAAGGDDAEDADDEVGAAPAGAMRTGVVAGVLSRASHELVACLAADEERVLTDRFGGDLAAAAAATSGGRERLLCVPMDRRMPLIRTYTRHAGRLLGARFVLRVDLWPRGEQFPEGHVVRVLGRTGDVDTERDALLAQHGVSTEPFCAAALASLPDARWTPDEASLRGRRDLRGARVASIDPPGCTDVDDALSVEPLDGGRAGWRVGVHIADVCAFVRRGSPLDAEAAARGTTVYLVGKRYDMLPAVLSENLCSLLAGRDRLAMSVMWDLGPDFTPIGTPWAGRTVIRSRHQLTYAEAQALLDGTTPPPGGAAAAADAAERTALRADLRVLDAFADAMRAAREAAGALELASAEVRFSLGDDGLPCAAAAKAPLPVMALVAELMIAANAAVAERISVAFPGAALVRRHAPPRADGLRELAELAISGGLVAGGGALSEAAAAAAAGAAIADGGRAALTAALAAAEAAAGDPAAAELLKVAATRAMAEAEYVSTGGALVGSAAAQSVQAGFAHFGLALRWYTHFTSPIRRYADVAVHRQLLAALAAAGDGAAVASEDAPPPSAPAVAALADNLNARHRAAKAVQKACSELYFMLLLQAQPRVERAVVAALRSDGLALFVPRFHVRAAVRLTDADGKPRPPAVSDDSAEATTEEEMLALDASLPGALRLLRADGGVAHAFKPLQRVWVELRAGGSRAHGLALRARLLDERHPAVAAARAATAQEALAAMLAPKAAQPAPLDAAMPPTPPQRSASARPVPTPPPPPSLASVVERLATLGVCDEFAPPPTPMPDAGREAAALRRRAALLEAEAGGASVRAEAFKLGTARRAEWEARAREARAAADAAWAALHRTSQ